MIYNTPYRYPLGKMPASSLFHNRNYYHTAARILVQQWGIMGAALNYVLSCSILFVLFTLILVYVILRKKHQN